MKRDRTELTPEQQRAMYSGSWGFFWLSLFYVLGHRGLTKLLWWYVLTTLGFLTVFLLGENPDAHPWAELSLPVTIGFLLLTFSVSFFTKRWSYEAGLIADIDRFIQGEKSWDFVAKLLFFLNLFALVPLGILVLWLLR